MIYMIMQCFVLFEKFSSVTVTVCAKNGERERERERERRHVYEIFLAHTVGNS